MTSMPNSKHNTAMVVAPYFICFLYDLAILQLFCHITGIVNGSATAEAADDTSNPNTHSAKHLLPLIIIKLYVYLLCTYNKSRLNL